MEATLTIEQDSMVEELADQIMTLSSPEKKALWERVSYLELQRGLNELSQRYRKRLEREGKANQTAEEVMAELRRIREEIAEEEYGHLLRNRSRH